MNKHFTICLLLALATLLVQHQSFAHSHGPGQTDSAKIVKTAQDSSHYVSDLLESAHHSIEADQSTSTNNRIKDLFNSWKKALNLKAAGLRAYRWSLANSGSDHALNIAFLFLASHSLEVASGPISVMIAGSQGASSEVLVGLAAVGTVISVPGLDPLCAILFGGYKFSPAFRNAVTVSRQFLSRQVSNACRAVGLQDLAQQYIARTSRLDLLQKQLSDAVQIEKKWTPEGKSEMITVRVFSADGTPVAEMIFEEKYSEYSLSTLRIPNPMTNEVNRKILEIAGHLNYNLRNAIQSALHAVPQYQLGAPGVFTATLVEELPFHINDIDGHKQETIVRFLPGALVLRDKLSFNLRSDSAACKNLFSL